MGDLVCRMDDQIWLNWVNWVNWLIWLIWLILLIWLIWVIWLNLGVCPTEGSVQQVALSQVACRQLANLRN